MKRTEAIRIFFRARQDDVAYVRWSHTRHLRRDIPIAATIIGLTMVVSVALSAAASQYAGNGVAEPLSLDGQLLVVTEANVVGAPAIAPVVEASSVHEIAVTAETAAAAPVVDPAPPATVVETAGEPDPELVAKLRARTVSKAEATDTAVSTESIIHNVNITFYDCATQNFCGHMYGGRIVHEGAAACSWNLALGTQFRIVGDPTERTYVCEDRGLLTNTWVDIFFYSQAAGYRWAASVPRVGTIEIVYRP